MQGQSITTTAGAHAHAPFVFRAPVILASIAGALYAAIMLVMFREDTAIIAGIGFMITAIFAALAFLYARASDDPDARGRLFQAGERLGYAALMMMTAGVVKGAASLLLGATMLIETSRAAEAVGFGASAIAAGLFLAGVAFAHMGLWTMQSEMAARIQRR